jgi:hypothetical protein
MADEMEGSNKASEATGSPRLKAVVGSKDEKDSKNHYLCRAARAMFGSG